MCARGPRLMLAAFLAGGSGALGLVALGGSAHADPAMPASTCGGALQPACVPTIHVHKMDADGTVHVTYTPTPTYSIEKDSLAATLTWSPQVTVPPGAPEPVPTTGNLTLTGCTSGPGAVTCDYSFPAPLQVKNYVLNGTYQVKASVQSCPLAGVKLLCTTAATGPTDAKTLVSVSNLPTAPTGVTAAAVPNSPTVKISWKQSPEPDVVGYQVLRADGSPACSLTTFPVPPGSPPQWACIDQPTKDGSYVYHVVAHRWPPGYSRNESDQPAAASSPTMSVTVTGTSANPTTTVPVGGGTLGPPGFTGKPLPNPRASGGTGSFNGKAPSPAVVAPGTPTSVDSGFIPTLPYGAPPPTTAETGTTDPSSIAAPVSPKKSKSGVATIAVVGAGLLIAVIALHGLWLRSEVRRDPTLEVLDPEH